MQLKTAFQFSICLGILNLIVAIIEFLTASKMSGSIFLAIMFLCIGIVGLTVLKFLKRK